jgi:hypothetical protein
MATLFDELGLRERQLVADQQGNLLAGAVHQLGGGLFVQRAGRTAFENIGHGVLLHPL